MEVIIGSYTQVVFGFNFLKKEDDEVWQFEPRFTDQGHSGAVKSVSVGGKYLATGSSDETIRLFDLKKHVELGVLVQQSGSITKIEFVGTTHMLSSSEDGTICVWKTKSWECEKVLKGHRGPVTCISIHPSGRLALSVSKDKTLRTWNLLTGRSVYTTTIKEVGELIKWSPSGNSYIIVFGRKVKYYAVGNIDDSCEYSALKYVLAVAFLQETVAIIGGEEDEIVIYDFKKKIVLQRFSAHKTRTKSINVVDNPYGNEDEAFVFTVASDGNLRAWLINKQRLDEQPKLIAGIDIPGRPTCMAVKSPPGETAKKGSNDNTPSEDKKEEKSLKQKSGKEITSQHSKKKRKKKSESVDNND